MQTEFGFGSLFQIMLFNLKSVVMIILEVNYDPLFAWVVYCGEVLLYVIYASHHQQMYDNISH
jgi:hypothetical protein